MQLYNKISAIYLKRKKIEVEDEKIPAFVACHHFISANILVVIAA